MRKKSKKNIIANPLIKKIFVCIGALLVVAICVAQVIKGIKGSDIFIVRKITIDPSIASIQSRDLAKVRGRSLFDVNVKLLENRLNRQFPQLSQINVIKRFPDEIYVVAKKRNAFAQTKVRRRNITLDSEGVVLFEMDKGDQNLPYIEGLKLKKSQVRIGSPIYVHSLQGALNLIKVFNENNVLSNYKISRIDVSNLSKINLYTSTGLRIIVDRNKTKQKLKILEMLLTQKKINFDEVKYIDLRFKEPIIKKK